MKKNLLLSSALVAAGLFVAGDAFAQAKPMGPLTVGGYWNFIYQFTNQDDEAAVGALAAAPGNNRRTNAFLQEGEIHFKGANTLDNGLQIGFRVELEAHDDNVVGAQDQIDEAWMDLRGSFGRVILGQFDPAVREMARAAPNGHRTNLLAMAGSEWGFTQAPAATAGTVWAGLGGLAGATTAGWTTFNGTTGSDAEKIVYFSPVFSGFQLGLSYMPMAAEYRANAPTPNLAVQSATGRQSEVKDLGVTYVNTLGGIGIAAMLGVAHANTEGNTTIGAAGSTTVMNGTTVEAYRGNLILSFAGFDFGGAYRKAEIAGSRIAALSTAGSKSSFDVTSWELGLSYTMGPWKGGISYFTVEDESVASSALGGSVEASKWLVSGSYLLGPGFTVDAGVAFEKLEGTAPGLQSQKFDGTTFFIGSSLQF